MEIAQQIETLIENLNLTEEQITQLTKNLATLKTNSLILLDDEVARAEQGTKLTRHGMELLGKAIAGGELKYTKAVIGDATLNGEVILPTEAEEYEFNDLIHPRLEIPMTDVSFSGGGTATIRCLLNNAQIKETFPLVEMGIFAKIDGGEEFLYCYRNTGRASDWVIAGGSAVIQNLILSLITVVDTATNVTAIVDANLAFVSQVEFSDHINSENPHPNSPTKSYDVEIANAIWVTDADSNLHKISAENLQRQILGGNASSIPLLDARVSQVEVNQANLYMQLKAESELGLKANLLLVENFDDYACCDRLDIPVLVAVAGISNFSVESDNGLRAGHWYTLTDGTRSQYVQIKSLIRNGDNYVVVTQNDILYEFDSTRTHLMRSTVNFEEGSAGGAGDIKGQTFKFDEVWRGIDAATQTTLAIPMTNQNLSAFDLTDDGTFTPSGEFSLTA